MTHLWLFMAEIQNCLLWDLEKTAETWYWRIPRSEYLAFHLTGLASTLAARSTSSRRATKAWSTAATTSSRPSGLPCPESSTKAELWSDQPGAWTSERWRGDSKRPRTWWTGTCHLTPDPGAPVWLEMLFKTFAYFEKLSLPQAAQLSKFFEGKSVVLHLHQVPV